MKAFTYERATDAVARPARSPVSPGPSSSPAAPTCLDLMKIEVETPTHLVDVQDLGFDKIEKTKEGGLRIGAWSPIPIWRRTSACAGLCGPDARDRRGREWPVAQQGLDRRQPAATDPLPLFLRHQHGVQQAQARIGLRGDRRLFAPAGRDRGQQSLHRDLPRRHGGGDARTGRGDRDGGRQRTAPLHSDRRFPPAVGRPSRTGHGVEAGRADHGGDPAQADRRQAFLREGAGPCLLCLCAGVGRGGDPARRHGSRRLWRRRPQAVARGGGGSAAAARRRRRHRTRLPGCDTTKDNAFKLRSLPARWPP